MKKIFLLFITVFTALQINAQSKVGTIDVDFILSKMPQLAQVEVDVKAYNKTLEDQLNLKIGAYQSLLDAYKASESTFTETVKKTKQGEIIALENDIQTFKANATKLSQIKQNESIQPLYSLIGESLDIVAKENGFTQILDANASLVYLDQAYDVTILVMKKMGLPLPQGK